jgi:hypothetical protein
MNVAVSNGFTIIYTVLTISTCPPAQDQYKTLFRSINFSVFFKEL